MPLVDVALPAFDDAPFPSPVRALLDESAQRIEAFLGRRGGDPVPGFVPADFDRIYRALRAIAAGNLAPGDSFCEWGSGFGVVALLATHLDFHACGIEIQPELVEEAESLAAAVGLEVEFVCGTLVPPAGQELTDVPQEFAWLSAGGACGHELLGVEPADFDLIFAYPWPGEEGVIEDLFERFAATSALLLTYHGYEDLRLRRKVDE